jgi:putative transposase
MPNHVHLVVVPETSDGLARAIGEAHRRYTRLINFREGWRGYLWQGRFASYPLDEHYLLAVVRYVELNPVRAGLVKDAGCYRWSSAQPHLQGKDDLLVRVKPMLELVDDWRDYLSYQDDQNELESIRRHTRTGRPLGGDDFIAALEDRLGRILRPRKPGPKNYKTKL